MSIKNSFFLGLTDLFGFLGSPIALVDGTKTAVAIVCSSGTTGLSKGVCVSHAALLNGVLTSVDMGSADICFSMSSIYWISGIVMMLLGSLFHATRIITTERFDPKIFLSIIQKYQVGQTNHRLLNTIHTAFFLRRYRLHQPRPNS